VPAVRMNAPIPSNSLHRRRHLFAISPHEGQNRVEIVPNGVPKLPSEVTSGELRLPTIEVTSRSIKLDI